MNKKFVLFKLNGEMCALRVNEVNELIEMDHLVKTNTKGLHVTNWDGRPLPVLDPISMLSPFDVHKPTISSRIIVVKKRGMDFGVLAEEVLGIIDIHRSEMEEPSLSEHRYVVGIYKKDVKIFEPEQLMTTKLSEKFQAIYDMDIEYLTKGELIDGVKAFGKDEVVEDLRLRTLNWSLKATKKNIEEDFIQEAMKIHNLATKL